MTNPMLALDTYYEEIESGLEVRLNPDYGPLVVPNGNSSEPVHRWFHLKEAFSCDLLRRVFKDLDGLDSDNLRVLDPFAGVGTTAVSVLAMAAQGDLHQPSVYGIEVNPFLHLVSSSKLRAYQGERPSVLRLARQVAAASLRDDEWHEPPDLSTFHNSHYYDPVRLQSLLRLRQSIYKEIQREGRSLTTDLLLVALGSVVERLSNLRRDGRALRYVKKPNPPHPVDMFLMRCERIEEDLHIEVPSMQGRVFRGDGVTMSRISHRFELFDLIIFSPPYPNNIDYTEVYKLENWFLGFVTDAVGFRQQRVKTLHSHPSISRPGRIPHHDLAVHENRYLRDLIGPILDRLPSDRYRRGRRELIEGYTLDMYRTLRAAKVRLKPGGHLIYVVGNSVHGQRGQQFVIAADVLIARLAIYAGLEVQTLEVARELTRRSCDSRFLRESVVFVRNADTESHHNRVRI